MRYGSCELLLLLVVAAVLVVPSITVELLFGVVTKGSFLLVLFLEHRKLDAFYDLEGLKRPR